MSIEALGIFLPSAKSTSAWVGVQSSGQRVPPLLLLPSLSFLLSFLRVEADIAVTLHNVSVTGCNVTSSARSSGIWDGVSGGISCNFNGVEPSCEDGRVSVTLGNVTVALCNVTSRFLSLKRCTRSRVLVRFRSVISASAMSLTTAINVSLGTPHAIRSSMILLLMEPCKPRRANAPWPRRWHTVI